MDAKTFAAAYASSPSPLFVALRRLTNLPAAAIATAGWPHWDPSGAGGTSIVPDGSPA